MLAKSPVVKGFEQHEVVFAKDQPPYLPMPVLPLNDGQIVISRWRMTWRERLKVLFTGNVYLWTWTFGRPFLPTAIECYVPAVVPDGSNFMDQVNDMHRDDQALASPTKPVEEPIFIPSTCKFKGCKQIAKPGRIFCADHVAMGARPMPGQ